MKNLFFIVLMMLSTISWAVAQNNFTPMQLENYAGPRAEWDKEIYDFGTIPKGVPVSVVFKFKNTGSSPLIIADVETTCGCTTPFYTKDPVMPGKEGQIKARYNAAQAGTFNKSITVKTNAGDSKKLTIKRGSKSF